MRINRSKVIVLVLLLSLILIIWWLVSTYLWRGEVEFTNLEGVTTISVDGTAVWLKDPVVDLRAGVHQVEVGGPMIEAYVAEVDVRPFGKTQFSAGRKLLNKEGLAHLLTQDDTSRAGYNVVNAQLHEENSWLTFTLTDPAGKRDNSDYIYHYSGSGWQLETSGTGLNYYTLDKESLPRSVLEAFDYR